MKKFYFMALAAVAASMSASAATANGTVSDGWLMIEDYQGSTAGTELTVKTYWNGDPAGSAVVAVDPKDDANLMGEFTGGDYNTLFVYNVTLPAGKTLKDYSNLAFDLYRYKDDSNYKQMKIYINGEKFYEDESYIQQAPDETWTAKTYKIEEDNATGNSFTLYLGIGTNEGHYAVDNIRLKERPQEVAPGTYYESNNGKEDGNILYVEDYQKGVVGDQADAWGIYGSVEASVLYAVDPTDAKNIVGEFKGGGYNDFFSIKVTLPEGKKLSDYKGVKIDTYRFEDDENYKKMNIYAEKTLLYQDESYVSQGNDNEWQTRTFDFTLPEDAPEGLADMNEFNLRIGISTNAGHYALDNVKLVAGDGSGVASMEAANEVVEYYSLSGMRVAADKLASGIYIRVKGGKAEKIMK